MQAVDVRAALADDSSAAAQARGITRSALSRWNLASLSETACLLVSELVANVVRHGAWPSELVISRRHDRVHFSVSDHDPSLPRRRKPEPADLSGRGLALVEDLAEAWGCESARADPDDARRTGANAEPEMGKVVWFELRAVRPVGL
jgi:anti-sigma regulatory factor (Ser/Thr protein kinase)